MTGRDMPRRKPTSTRQKKTDIQLKRAIKRGDAPPPEPKAKSRNQKQRRGPDGGSVSGSAAAHAARRLQSAFVTLPPKFLEETRLLASKLTLHRPVPEQVSMYPLDLIDPNASQLTCVRRPKWRFDMTKKEVEHNEEGLFKKWLEETDRLILAWQRSGHTDESDQKGAFGGETPTAVSAMPRSPTYFERNLEVWRQLWRVIEISQILCVLLDSRCPLLHLPPSLIALLPDRGVILALTKVDICGLERASAWAKYFRQRYPQFHVVMVESYLPKEESTDHQGRTQYLPHLPQAFRERLVDAIQAVHAELLTPPDRVKANPSWLKSWKSPVKRDVNWDSLLTPEKSNAGARIDKNSRTDADDNDVDQREVDKPDVLTIGMIGQPNVGKSSLLNALFGSHRVKASKTPGKTKHYQTLYWTPEVRLVDCPGLVMPNLVPMEMQAFCGILPISRVSAIPSCIHFVAERLPIERVYGLCHPRPLMSSTVDKRTWREGARPQSSEDKQPSWTTMDILTAYANKNNWVTAKAGRPDIHRAGNAILRTLAEGKIGWAYWPPGMVSADNEDQGNGLWIPHTRVMYSSETESVDDDTTTEDSLLSDEESLTQSDSEDTEERYLTTVSRFQVLAIDAEAEYESD